MSTLELDHQLNRMIIEGKSTGAFQRFYAEDVVSQENDEPERVGRDAWMRARQEMEKSIKKFDARVLAHAASGHRWLQRGGDGLRLWQRRHGHVRREHHP